MKTKIFTFSLFLLFACSCNSGSSKTSQADTTAVTKPVADTLDCPQLISLLFKSSSYSVKGLNKEKLHASVDQVSDSNVIIKVDYLDAATTINGTIGWLSLNLKDRTLNDITADPEDPKPVTFDDKTLVRLLKNCSFTNE